MISGAKLIQEGKMKKLPLLELNDVIMVISSKKTFLLLNLKKKKRRNSILIIYLHSVLEYYIYSYIIISVIYQFYINTTIKYDYNSN